MSRAAHAKVHKGTKGINRRLAFGIAAAPLAWLLFELVAFMTIGRNCARGDEFATWQWVILIFLIAFCVGLAIAGIAVAFRVFKNWRRDGRLIHAEGWDRIEFMALFGVFTSGLLLLNILYFSVLPLVIQPCVRAI